MIKRYITIMLWIALLSVLLLGVAVCAEAHGVTRPLGDADLDGNVTILDATRIQRVLAELDEMTPAVRAAADADRDGEMTVMDATRIQRYLSELCNLDGSTPFDPHRVVETVTPIETSTLPTGLSEPSENPPASETVLSTQAPSVQPTVQRFTLSTPHITRVEGSNNGAVIVWNAVKGAEKYRVFVKLNSKWQKIGDTSAAKMTYSGAKQGTVYTYTVRCVSADGSNFLSDYDAKGFSASILETPVISSVTSLDRKITIRWNAVPGAAKYRVFYQVNGSWKKLGDTASTSFTYTHSDSDARERYTVRCMNAAATYFTSGYSVSGYVFTFSIPKEPAYIGNSSTHKFHYPSCNDVKKMNLENIVRLYSRNEAVSNGYTPCGHCNP